MKKFAIHNNQGEIFSVLSAPNEKIAALQNMPYVECGEDVSDVSHYVKNGNVVKRTEYDEELIKKGLTVIIKKLPKGTSVEVEGFVIEVTEGEVEIDFDLPGSYEIHLTGPVQYVPKSIGVNLG